MNDYSLKPLALHVRVIPVLAREISGCAGVSHELLRIDDPLKNRQVDAGVELFERAH